MQYGLEVLKSIERNNVRINHLNFGDGKRPIHYAAEIHNPELIKLLSQQNGFDVNVVDDFGLCCLHYITGEKFLSFLLENFGEELVINAVD